MNVKENLKVWQLLSEINKTGNLTDAAKSLDIPLSRASKLINQLEEELGYTVLDRSKKPALLTWEVKKLMPYVQRLLCNWKFISSPEFIKGTGVRKNLEYSLTVSFPVNSDGTKFINSLTHICRTKYPNLQLQFTSATTRCCLRRVTLELRKSPARCRTTSTSHTISRCRLIT